MTRTPAPDAPGVYLAEPAQPIQLTFLPEFNALLAVDWWEHAHFVQTVGKVPTGPGDVPAAVGIRRRLG